MKTEIKIRRLAEAARKFRARKGKLGLKWSEEFQNRASEVLGSGVSVLELSGAIGVDVRTLRSWSQGMKTKVVKTGFRKLRIVGRLKSVKRDAGPVKIFVTTSQGSEVHGLSAEEIATLIKRGVL